jgi:hypothetical protein
MRSWLVVVLLVACGGGAKSVPPTNTGAPVAEPVATAPSGPPSCKAPLQPSCLTAGMEYFATSICKCTDKACADQVNDGMMKWAQDLTRTADKDEKPDPDLAKRATEIMNRYTECMTKIYMVGAGQDDPPPPEEEDNPCGN